MLDPYIQISETFGERSRLLWQKIDYEIALIKLAKANLAHGTVNCQWKKILMQVLLRPYMNNS